MEGINDIGIGARATGDAAVTADDLIAGHKQLIERAHMHGVKAIGATLTPFAGAAYYSEEGEAARTALNQWIRTSKAYDAVLDFDAADARSRESEADPPRVQYPRPPASQRCRLQGNGRSRRPVTLPQIT